MASGLRDALVDEVRDLYHMEKQLVRALPKMAKGASNEDLRETIESHLEETAQQVERLEEVFGLLGEKVRGKVCSGMAGIIEEGSDVLGEDFEDDVMDAAIIASAQRAEHYEIAAYGSAAAWADALGLTDVAALLLETLEEEKAADVKLSALAEDGINAAASAEDDEDGDDEETPASADNRMAMSAAGRKASPKARKR